MRVIIACADPGKWGDYLGVPKHLAPLTAHGGEPLLHRTVRQALAWTDDVVVTGPDDRYDVPGAARYWPGEQPSEYAGSRPWWNTNGRTVLLLGDCYFTDEAMETIGSFRTRLYQVFGRRRASRQTGTPYGEIFAVSWWPEHHLQMDAYLRQVHAQRAAGTVTRPPGWMLLRAWQGTPLGRHIVKQGMYFQSIDDWTDDLDTPADYERHPATRTTP